MTIDDAMTTLGDLPQALATLAREGKLNHLDCDSGAAALTLLMHKGYTDCLESPDARKLALYALPEFVRRLR